MKYLVRLLCLTLVLSLASAPAAQVAAQQEFYHEDSQHSGYYGAEQYDEFDEQAYHAWPYRPSVRPTFWFLGVLVGAVIAMIFMNDSTSSSGHH